MHILYTDLNTFPKVLARRIFLKSIASWATDQFSYSRDLNVLIKAETVRRIRWLLLLTLRVKEFSILSQFQAKWPDGKRITWKKHYLRFVKIFKNVRHDNLPIQTSVTDVFPWLPRGLVDVHHWISSVWCVLFPRIGLESFSTGANKPRLYRYGKES